MTAYHAGIIVTAIVAAVVCGHSATCAASFHDIMDLCKYAIIGAFAHAGQQIAVRSKTVHADGSAQSETGKG